METAEQWSAAEGAPAYLVLDAERVYEILPNAVMNIGRLESNDIALDDYKVSREHAVLKYDSQGFTLVDLASTHGTFVNGQRIDRYTLNFGDIVQISDHELVLYAEPPPVEENQALVSSGKMVRSLDRRLKFFGGLNDFALITIVQFLAQEKQSGLLLLEVGQNPGPRLYFQEGEIIHVSNGENLAELLTREHHDQSLFFYFHHEIHFPLRTIHEPTANFLMTLVHNYDQRREDSAADPLAATAQLNIPPVALETPQE